MNIRAEHEQISILLVDSETLVRQALCGLINSFENFRVIEQASTKGEALSALHTKSFDLVCTEINLLDDSGLSLIQEMTRTNPKVRSVVISSNQKVAVIQQAISFGAKAYIFKSSSAEELRSTLSKVASDAYVSPANLPLKTNKINGGATSLHAHQQIDPLYELSPREREIFHLLASGLQNTVIAKRLFISPRTVETHRARIVRKLNLVSNGELIRFAIKHGLSSV